MSRMQQCDYCKQEMVTAELMTVEANLPAQRGQTWQACPTCYKPIKANPMIPNDPLTQDLLAEFLAKMYRHYTERLRAEGGADCE